MGGGASPARKLARVRELTASGAIVAMIGDGRQRRRSARAAPVSVAMGSGAFLAAATADAVLLSNRPQDLGFAVRHAARVLRRVKQNFALAFGYNLIVIPLAAMGRIPPWAAAIGMSASSAMVVLNALRLRDGRSCLMESVFLLVPLAAVLALGTVAALFWAVRSGQFEDLEGPAHRILMDDDAPPPPRSGPSGDTIKGHDDRTPCLGSGSCLVRIPWGPRAEEARSGPVLLDTEPSAQPPLVGRAERGAPSFNQRQLGALRRSGSKVGDHASNRSPLWIPECRSVPSPRSSGSATPDESEGSPATFCMVRRGEPVARVPG